MQLTTILLHTSLFLILQSEPFTIAQASAATKEPSKLQEGWLDSTHLKQNCDELEHIIYQDMPRHEDLQADKLRYHHQAARFFAFAHRWWAIPGHLTGSCPWKTLIGSQASLKANCNKEGFNSIGPFEFIQSKARIGIISNNRNNCFTSDSRIGFGFGFGWRHDDNNTVLSADNGDKHIKASEYILVQ